MLQPRSQPQSQRHARCSSPSPLLPTRTTRSKFLSLPREVRDLIYTYAISQPTIHVISPTLHRTTGPNRPANRSLPSITHVSHQLRAETIPILAKQSTLVFTDYFNLSHLLNAVPKSFSKHVRSIALSGDIVPGSLFTQFPSLKHVRYTQLGSCLYPPLPENGMNKQAMKAKQSDLVELVLGRSPTLTLLADVLCDKERKGGEVRLTAEASVLSCHERVVVWVDVNREEIICRRLMGVHRLWDCEEEKS